MLNILRLIDPKLMTSGRKTSLSCLRILTLIVCVMCSIFIICTYLTAPHSDPWMQFHKSTFHFGLCFLLLFYHHSLDALIKISPKESVGSEWGLIREKNTPMSDTLLNMRIKERITCGFYISMTSNKTPAMFGFSIEIASNK